MSPSETPLDQHAHDLRMFGAFASGVLRALQDHGDAADPSLAIAMLTAEADRLALL